MTSKHKGPGKADRKGITLIEAIQKFSDETIAEQWLVERRWPDGIRCPYCASDNVTPRTNGRKTPAYRCNPCKRDFTVKTGTIMHDSKLPLSKWCIAFYLYNTNLKGVSSMKLHRDLGITQKSAWHMAHRIREAWNVSADKFTGPVEVDETYIGGKESNKHESKKLRSGRGAVGKTPIAGAKDRETGQVKVAVVERTDRPTLQGFVRYAVEPGTTVYTDEHAAYRGITTFGIDHEAVKHSVGEYVNGQAHTNGIENFWSHLKRGYHGVYHQMSPKHLHRYAIEFAGRHNTRPMDTVDQMTSLAVGAVDKHLPYAELIGPVEERMPAIRRREREERRRIRAERKAAEGG